MKLQILGSNSAGNCYILSNESEALIIELGVNFKDIKKALGFNLRKVVGAIVTHEHLDHSKAIGDALAAGINVHASKGTLEAMGRDKHHRACKLYHNEIANIGNFKVLPFNIKHDCAEPFGFLINHTETGNILFLTDTRYAPFTFKGLNNIIVEANYCQKIIDQKVAAGASPEFLRNRVLKSHMSIETTKALLAANDLSQVNNIVLIHLSDSNSDESGFKNEIETLTGKSVTVADKGITIENFNKAPF